MTPLELLQQEELKKALQAEKSGKSLENLAAALVGSLLGIPIAIAASGFQFGADAGTAGRQGRHLRIECKKYSDDTALSDRELLGEMDQAVGRDEALEAWILVATRSVPEQLADHLTHHGERLGVPVLIIDWKDREPAPLAALCASNPETVELLVSEKVADLARSLQPAMGDAIASLRRSLEEWSIGFDTLRIKSHEKVRAIWMSERTSKAELGQDAAGGAQSKKVRRQSVHTELDAWWNGAASNDAPAAILGWDGVGKTWAALDWLVERIVDQPIVLVVPSSAAAGITEASASSVKRFLAERLLDLTGVKDVIHWSRRLDHLLKRPSSEGPLLTVLFDGVNQEPSVPWLPLFKSLQGAAFEGKIRVMLTTRQHHFDDRLSRLRGLVVSAVSVVVDVYDIANGGELDQMLEFEGLKRDDLHPDLVELARTPRLFKLVIRFRERLVDAGQVTVHRLLWEYGRDSFGDRAGKSFSEDEWHAWLSEIATGYRNGVQEYSLRSLGETTNRPDLTTNEVYARLSDIIDGRFVQRKPSGVIQLNPITVAHALGAALLAHLDAMSSPTFAEAENEISQWLDPISGLDSRAEILRAAVSIFIEQHAAAPIGGVLVTAWLQTQNVTDTHRQELARLASSILDALLDAVEHSRTQAQASARIWAINALRAIPRTDELALKTIIARIREWLSIVSREVDNGPHTTEEHQKMRSERYRRRIGIDESGQMTVLGVTVRLVDRDDGRLQAAAPSILEGFPLVTAVPCFEMMAVAAAIRGHSDAWQGMKWLCYLNELDPEPLAIALRSLSAELETRPSESGVHAELAKLAASLLLWLSGQEADEDRAATISPNIDHHRSYEKDYLQNPSTSVFRLERRHASMALEDKTLSLHLRLSRTKDLWLDPTFPSPDAFIAELREAAESIDVENLHRQMGRTQEDWSFEQLEPALARCAPDLLAKLMRSKLRGLSSCPQESRYWSAIHATDAYILAGEAEAAAARTLRQSAREKEENREAFAACDLIRLELRSLPDPQQQFDLLIAAELSFIPADLVKVMRAPSPEDVDTLIARYSEGSEKQQHDLVLLLSVHPVVFSDRTWTWLAGLIDQSNDELRGVLFRMLTLADSKRLGRILINNMWSWNPTSSLWVNHYGSGALMQADLPFDHLALRIAPWRVLEAARLRGGEPGEVRLAAEIFGQVLAANGVGVPDPGSIVTVDRTDKWFAQPTISFHLEPNPEEPKNPEIEQPAARDADARTEAFMRAVKAASARIEDARKSGASLYLTDVKAQDMEQVVLHASDLLSRWLEGDRDISEDFRRRVLLAEPTFLALCEALLIHTPERGVALWHALRVAIKTHYRGAAGIDELLHIVFRAPDSPPIASLRDEIVTLAFCPTDRDLLNVAAAAAYNGRAGVIAKIAAEDMASSLVWRQRRGIVLAGFSIGNALPIKEAWPEGHINTDIANLRREAAHLRWRDACSQHWWQAFLDAPDTATAYAAWILFCRSADIRAWAWVKDAVTAQNNESEFLALKLAHIEFNRSQLTQAIEAQLDSYDRKLFFHDTVDGVGPWGKAE